MISFECDTSVWKSILIDGKNISFNGQYFFDFKSDYLDSELILYLSDSLDASQEVLTESYLDKVSSFINSIDVWYPPALRVVREWGEKLYGNGGGDIHLQSIHILFEQSADTSVFGLQFRPEFDIEHGAGIKINGESYEIIEVGSADIAFC